MQQQQQEPLKARTHTHTRAKELADFNRKRRHNALRLKNRFTDIIERYSHDFEDVGDVIDLGTGKVVVDNGHLRDMEGELDPAYDLCAWGDEEEEGEGGFAVDEEEIDELGVDMLTEGEAEALRGVVPQTDFEDEQIQLVSQEENMEMALVALPPAELSPIPIGEQKKFEAPMFPQLEMAVNTMTTMLQQQMMAMLGQVLPGYGTPQPWPESRQILPAPPPQASLKRRFDDLTLSHSAEYARIHTQSPEPQTSSPKSHALKRRRISDAQEKREGQLKAVPGRKLRIKSEEAGTPQAQTHGASLWKTPKSMPAQSQQSMALRLSRVKTESKSSPAISITKMSQLLPDEDTSEDELSSLVMPRRVEASATKVSAPKAGSPKAPPAKADTPKAASPETNTLRVSPPAAGILKASTPKASTPAASTLQDDAPRASSLNAKSPKLPSPTRTKRLSPRVVIMQRPVAAPETANTDTDNTPAPIVQSPTPSRERRRKSRILISEQHNRSESRAPDPVDELKVDSEIEPPQPLDIDEDMFADDDEHEPPKEATSGVTSEAVPSPSPRKVLKRRRRTCLDRLLVEAENYTVISQDVRDVMESRRESQGRPRRGSPITSELEAVTRTREMKSRTTFGANERPDSRRISADNHVFKSEDEPGETERFLSWAATDGPITIVDMTMLVETPEPQERKVTP